MLRVIQNSQAAGAKSYYSTADYYSEGQELSGVWRGEAARKLGLAGEVRKADWEALCDNRHPASGDQLTARQRRDRTVGYDFNWHVPKSVSLLYAMTKDERILDAFRDAVDATMHDIEAEASTRVRKDGKHENRRTGNLAWGEFVHFTSRPVDEVPDPHLHAHCFVFNSTWDDKEQAWKAGQFRELKRDAPFFEAVFHSRLAHRLGELGLPIERSKHGWELAGVDKGLIDKFSRRTAQIEDKAREMGIDNAEAKDGLGAKTRERKQKDLSFTELQDTWRERMTAPERDALAALESKLGGDTEPLDDTAAARAVEYAIGHLFERRSVVPERQLLTEAIKRAHGMATVEDITRSAASSGLIVADRNGRRMVTTPGVLGEEKRVIAFAREGRGTCKSFGRCDGTFKREWLNDAQKNAVKHVVESHDRVIVMRGAAGVGKTSLMQEAVEMIEGRGTRVVALAPSASASRGTLRDAGFEDADTVARFLLDERFQERARGQLVWIDEAGLLGTKAMANLFDIADRIDARVLLSGDRRQHGSVERGAVLRLLEEEAGLKPAEVKEIQRQSGEYKSAVKALSEGRVEEGFKRLDGLGWVREVPSGERYRQLAADYSEAAASGKSALVVSPTHAEGERITAEIRRTLRESGTLDQGERAVGILVNANLTEAERRDRAQYGRSDVLVFHQNAKGHKRGDRVSVEANKELPLDQAARFQAFRAGEIHLAPGDVVRITRNGFTADGKHRLDNGTLHRIRRFDAEGNIVFDNGWVVGKGYGHLAYGYVITSHASQGRTVDRVFVGQSGESFGASSAEQFYVSASRAREQAVIYTDDKQSLLDAISREDDRLTATELTGGGRGRNVTALRQYEHDREGERKEREREELSHER